MIKKSELFFQIKELDLTVRNKKGTLKVKNSQGSNYCLYSHYSCKKNTETLNLHSGFGKFCGAYRIRTDDFLAASQVL